jgi:hypothetical protein
MHHFPLVTITINRVKPFIMGKQVCKVPQGNSLPVRLPFCNDDFFSLRLLYYTLSVSRLITFLSECSNINKYMSLL